MRSLLVLNPGATRTAEPGATGRSHGGSHGDGSFFVGDFAVWSKSLCFDLKNQITVHIIWFYLHQTTIRL